jgi:ubiquinol-cytochrome c reductase cytochrome b subunit
MRYSKLNPITRASVSNLQDSATPSSINYAYNFGSLLGILMTFMVASGILLAIHYIGSSGSSFGSVEHIMADVREGYVVRYLHANTASFVFITMYAHIIRNVYYSSYRQPRTGTFLVGQIIVILIIGTAFLGYSLVYGQMSLWGATVISNLATAIPYIGEDILQILWGAHSVSTPTLTKFYSLHYLLALVVLALAVVHLLILHMHASSSPLGTAGSYDRYNMQPLFLVKDVVTLLAIIITLYNFISYVPNYLGHGDNFIEANALVTPSSIVPEWYLLPYYAVLRAVPNKLLGVALMLLSLLWLSVLTLDVSILRSNTFKPFNRTLLAVGLFSFVALLALGSQHAEPPYVGFGQALTLGYFAVLLFMVPLSGTVENSMVSQSR